MVRRTQMAVDIASSSDMGSSRRGAGVTSRAVSMATGLGTFTGCRRRFRYLGSQLARATEPATTSPVAANAFVPHFVAGRPSRLANFYMECRSTILLESLSSVSPGVASHNRNAVDASLLAAYICQETLTVPGVFFGAATSAK